MLPYTCRVSGALGRWGEVAVVGTGMAWWTNRRRRRDSLCVAGCCARVYNGVIHTYVRGAAGGS